MGEFIGRKRRAVAAGALALTLGVGLGLGAVAWGSENAASEEDVRPGEAWAPSVGGKLAERAEGRARSYRAEVQRMLAAHRRVLEAEAQKADVGETASGAPDVPVGRPTSLPEEDADAAAGDGAADPEGPSRSVGQSGGRTSSEASTSGGEGRGGASEAPAPESASPEDSGSESGSSGSDDARPEEGAGAAGSLAPGTLVVGGTAISYRDVRGGTTPSSGGGLWLGSDAVDDGGWGYFVGHNPGSFAPVRSLSLGDGVTVCDRSGVQRVYAVRDVFQVEETATWKTIASRVIGYGESVVLQTCAGDGMNVIVVAA